MAPGTELELAAAGDTDVGKRRELNEDAVLVRDDLGLYAVADGAGGHSAGDVASRLALRSMENYFGATIRATHERPEFDNFGIPTGARRLSASILKANRDVVEVSKSSPKHKGMGTTVVAAAFSRRSGLMHIAHVGDSRCYRLRSGHLEQLTQDHSLLTDVLEQRPELEDVVLARLPKNVVTRALGMDVSLRVSIGSRAVVAGDRYLLCSDGLSGAVPASALADVLSDADPPDATVIRLIELANDAGSPDNVAALVIDCEGGHALALPSSASAPPPPPTEGHAAEDYSDPELLILGIEDLSISDLLTTSDDFLRALSKLVSPDQDQ